MVTVGVHRSISTAVGGYDQKELPRFTSLPLIEFPSLSARLELDGARVTEDMPIA